jgi:glycosyltransferase involved in cell wall biosynthesis
MDIPLILEDNGDHLADLDAKGIAPKGIQRSLSIRTTRWTVNQATYTVSTGEGWRKQFLNRWQVDVEKVSVIENGTVVPSLIDCKNLRSFQKLSAANQIPTLVYLGGFYPWHGVEILLKAFNRALDSKSPLLLILIGSGPGELEAHQLVKDLQISDSVNFAGHLSPTEFVSILGNSDIGLSPYCNWMEYSGLKIFDYKAAGLAVIASGENGMPSTLTDGKTGLIIPPCNQDALTSAILKLANNLDWTWKMGRVGRFEAETKHQWKHTVQNLETLFSNINKK